MNAQREKVGGRAVSFREPGDGPDDGALEEVVELDDGDVLAVAGGRRFERSLHGGHRRVEVVDVHRRLALLVAGALANHLLARELERLRERAHAGLARVSEVRVPKLARAAVLQQGAGAHGEGRQRSRVDELLHVLAHFGVHAVEVLLGREHILPNPRQGAAPPECLERALQGCRGLRVLEPLYNVEQLVHALLHGLERHRGRLVVGHVLRRRRHLLHQAQALGRRFGEQRRGVEPSLRLHRRQVDGVDDVHRETEQDVRHDDLVPRRLTKGAAPLAPPRSHRRCAFPRQPEGGVSLAPMLWRYRRARSPRGGAA